MDCVPPSASTDVDRVVAILHSQATRVDDVHAYSACARLIGEHHAHKKRADLAEKDRVDYSFIHKLITNAIDRQNVLRLTGFDFDFMADILNMRVNRALIGLKRDPMNRI